MSQYRTDRDAARQRIADLEAKLAEREAALSAQDVAVAERDAEIARLRHQLILSGILGHRHRPVHAAWTTRMVVLALGLAATALGVGVLAVRTPRQVVVEVVSAPTQEPFFADPAPRSYAPPPPPAVTDEPPAPIDASLALKLEPKVWAGRASVEEIRLLERICAQQGDTACRDRCAAMLKRPKPRVF
ncbi:MAG: hypothetical protein QM820_31905 [Minicystis sp.]